MDMLEQMILQAKNGTGWNPEFAESQNYKFWKAILDIKTCKPCRDNHGKIWLVAEKAKEKPPLHPNCRCSIIPLQTIKSGTATTAKTNGADWHLKYNNRLPDYYISESELKELGWERGNKPSKFAPGKMLYKDYSNKNHHLPDSPNRTWYEADINYTQGKRNSQRILWSNDGLIFVTFDHYETFYEIV